MGNKTSTDIQIKMDKTTYYPGDTISSSIFINAPQPKLCSKIVLHIEGFEESEFRSEVGKREILNSQNTLMRTFFTVKDFHSTAALLHGQYEFPCQFILPWVLPGSFHEEEKGKYKAKIVYQMKVILVHPKNSKENFEKIQEIIIRERQKQIDEYQFGKVLIRPHCLFFKNLGVCEVKCWFQRKNYLPKEDCVMICQIDNKSKRDINRVKCEFKKTISLRSTNGLFTTMKETISTVEFQGARKGMSLVGPLAQKVHLPLSYKKTSVGIHPSTTGNFVKCEYSIEITPQVGGCFTKGNKSFKVSLQILHPELIQNIQAPAEGWKPEVGMMSKIDMVQKDEDQMRKSVILDEDSDQFAC